MLFHKNHTDKIIIKSKSLIKGDFTLSSGIQTDWYFDARRLLLTGDGSRWVGSYLSDFAFTKNIHLIGGPVMGAIPMVTAAVMVANWSGIVNLNGFYIRLKPKKYGRKFELEGMIENNRDVIIVDDVCTTGYSLLSSIATVKEIGCTVKEVVVLLDRSFELPPIIDGDPYPITYIKNTYNFKSIIDENTIVELKNGQ